MKKAVIVLLLVMLVGVVSGFDYITYDIGDATGNCSTVQMPRTPVQPTHWQTYTDPNFNSVIRRVTDADADGGAIDGCSNHIIYSMFTHLNSDGSKLVVQTQGISPCTGWGSGSNAKYAIYNTTDGSFIQFFPPSGYENYVSNEPRWDDNDPNVLYFVAGSQLRKYNFSDSTNILLYDFQDYYDGDPGPSETVLYIGMKTIGDFSWDRRYFAFRVNVAGDQPGGGNGNIDSYSGRYIAIYDIVTDSVIASRSIGDYCNAYYGSVGDTQLRFASMSPSGSYVMIEGCDDLKYDTLDLNLNKVITIKGTGIDVGHHAWGYDANGDDVIVANGWGGTGCTDQWVAARMSDGHITCLWDPSNTGCPQETCNLYYRSGKGMYVSSIMSNDDKNKGYFSVLQFSRCIDANGDPLENCWGDKELLLFKVQENPLIWRVAHNENCYVGYWDRGRLSFDQQGKYLYFDSDWCTLSSDANGRGVTDIYRIELPPNWQEDLSGPISNFHDADIDHDLVINKTEINAYVERWKGDVSISLSDMVDAIGKWKAGGSY
ncbi:MAG: hypothetical protein ABIB79_02610 [archaeon]